MTSLKRLHLADNFFTSLPNTIGNLTQLEDLVVENSYLLRLPDELCQCTSLGYIDIRAPFLTSIPEWLGTLPNLRIVSFEGCNITHVPESLADNEKVETIYLMGNPLNEEFWELMQDAEQIWVRWRGKSCRISGRPVDRHVQTGVPDDGSLYGDVCKSFQVEHGVLVVEVDSTKFCCIDLAEQFKERTAIDLCELTDLNRRLVYGVSYRLLDSRRLFVDVYLKMAPKGIKRRQYLIDWVDQKVLGESALKVPGRDDSPLISLPGNRVTLDAEYDAVVIDVEKMQELGMLFGNAENRGDVDHEELQVLGVAEVDDNRCMIHWGQVGESFFETYVFPPGGAWSLESRVHVEADEIESFIRLGDQFVYVEVWVNAAIEQYGDTGLYEIGTIRALGHDVPLLPMLCSSVEGLAESTMRRKKILKVAGYDPMLCCVLENQLAYLDPCGVIFVTDLAGDYAIHVPPEGTRYLQLVSFEGRLFARTEHGVSEIELES